MTQPRYVPLNSTFMVTRRTTERRFFLKPSKTMRAIFMYVLAWAAMLVGVQIIAAYCASNHYHIVLFDPHSRVSDFAQRLNSLLGRIVNWRLKRSGCALWDNRPPNICRIEDQEGLLDAIAYVAANPVQDGILKHGIDWPGVRTRPEQLGTTTFRRRPRIRFFSKKTKMKAEIPLTFHVPPSLKHWDVDELKAELDRRIEAAEEKARLEMALAGRTFLGIKAVMGAKNSTKGTAFEARGAKNMIIPHIIAGCRQARIAAISRLKTFRAEYRQARDAFVAGERDVLFPYGTLQMARTAGVCCKGPPPA